MPRSAATVTALVLNRRNSKETDRLLTLLCQEKGKFVAIAKGVRKHAAARQSFLEPGNIIRAQILEKNFPIVGQVEIVESTQLTQLQDFRKFLLLLELYEQLFVEEALEPSLFDELLELRTAVAYNKASRKIVQQKLTNIIQQLGFHIDEKHATISSLVEEITGRQLKSYRYLSP